MIWFGLLCLGLILGIVACVGLMAYDDRKYRQR